MNLEENRLRTFRNWPIHALARPENLAEAGFFSTQQGFETECFACHIKVSSWQLYGDKVIMAKHEYLNPQCPFILNPLSSGNVPMVKQEPTRIDIPSPEFWHYHNEMSRLDTFANWPIENIVRAESLAKAGFFYLGTEDKTRCAFCTGVVRSWEEGDIPDLEHKKHFPKCPFVINTIIPRLHNTLADETDRSQGSSRSFVPNINNADLEDDRFNNLGVIKHCLPKRSDYATFDSRLKSFATWSPNLIQKPELLAQAGFYYEGQNDEVRCFHCDGGLGHWDPPDDPWTEHAKWFPNCSFVKLVKGQEFIAACCTTGSENAPAKSNKVNKLRVQTRRIGEGEIQAHMTDSVALAALSVGIDMQRVKRAIKQKLQQTGTPFSNPDALVEAALNVQYEEDDEYGNASSSNDDLMYEMEIPRSEVYVSSRPSEDLAPSVFYAENSDLLSPSSDLDKSVSLEEENRLLKEARQCKICMDAEVEIVFIPCGHLSTCVYCAVNLNECPLCRSEIKGRVRTFLS